MTAIAPQGTKTTWPPEGTSPTVSRPRALVEAADILRARDVEIEGELADVETRMRALLAEQATIRATLRVGGA